MEKFNAIAGAFLLAGIVTMIIIGFIYGDKK